MLIPVFALGRAQELCILIGNNPIIQMPVPHFLPNHVISYKLIGQGLSHTHTKYLVHKAEILDVFF